MLRAVFNSRTKKKIILKDIVRRKAVPDEFLLCKVCLPVLRLTSRLHAVFTTSDVLKLLVELV